MRRLPTNGNHQKCYRDPAFTHTCIQASVHLQAHTYTHTHTHTHTQSHTRTHTHTNTHKNTQKHTHMQDHMHAHAETERCTFNLTSLLGHTSAEPKKLGTGMHAPEDGICHNILTKSRQHPLQSTYIVLFLDIAAISKKKTCYLGMASLRCS